jgi:hypothetical protein
MKGFKACGGATFVHGHPNTGIGARRLGRNIQPVSGQRALQQGLGAQTFLMKIIFRVGAKN